MPYKWQYMDLDRLKKFATAIRVSNTVVAQLTLQETDFGSNSLRCSTEFIRSTTTPA
jgi:hypothetical protein